MIAAVLEEKKKGKAAVDKAKAALEREKKAKEKAVVGAERKGKKEGEKKRNIEIAKQMKKKNEPLEKIMDYTGLTKIEITNIK